MFHKWNMEISSAEKGLDGIMRESGIVHTESKISLYITCTNCGFVGIDGKFLVLARLLLLQHCEDLE